MKKNWFKLIGVTALVAVIGLGLAGCGDSGGDDGPDYPSANPDPSPKSGSLVGVWEGATTGEHGNIGSTAQFTASSVKVSQGSQSMEINYTYDSGTNAFTASQGQNSASGTATVSGTTLTIILTPTGSGLDGTWTWKQ